MPCGLGGSIGIGTSPDVSVGVVCGERWVSPLGLGGSFGAGKSMSTNVFVGVVCGDLWVGIDMARAGLKSVLSGRGGGAESSWGKALGVILLVIFLTTRGDGLGRVLGLGALGHSHVDSLVFGL